MTFDYASGDVEYAPVYRQKSHYNPLHTFRLPRGNEKHYQQQYADMYFLRLAKLKTPVEQVATEAWDGFSVRWPSFGFVTARSVC